MYNFFSRGSQFFRGDRLGIIRRQHSGGDDKKIYCNEGGGGVVIRIVKSPPTHP